jgi:hypothetical protein
MGKEYASYTAKFNNTDCKPCTLVLGDAYIEEMCGLYSYKYGNTGLRIFAERCVL